MKQLFLPFLLAGFVSGAYASNSVTGSSLAKSSAIIMPATVCSNCVVPSFVSTQSFDAPIPRPGNSHVPLFANVQSFDAPIPRPGNSHVPLFADVQSFDAPIPRPGNSHVPLFSVQ
jgi:hypothetical protein